jgi:hypothetical protein
MQCPGCLKPIIIKPCGRSVPTAFNQHGSSNRITPHVCKKLREFQSKYSRGCVADAGYIQDTGFLKMMSRRIA